MQQLIRYEVVYLYDRNGRLRKDGTAAVIVRAGQGKRYVHFNSKVYISPDQWDGKRREVVRHPRQRFLNSIINGLRNKLMDHEEAMIRQFGSCTLDQLKTYNQDRPGQDFIKFFRQQMEEERKRVAAVTYGVYRQTITKLEAYRPTLSFAELTSGFILNFLNHLRGEGLHHNTVRNHFKNIRKYVNLAIRIGYMKGQVNPCLDVRWKEIESNKIFLTKHELRQFEEFIPPSDKDAWILARQAFLFSCYTGLRFSDLTSFTEEDLQLTDEGVLLFYTAQKTGKSSSINLRLLFPEEGVELSKPEQIVKERLAASDYVAGSPLFPFSNTAYFNKLLKQMAVALSLRRTVQTGISSKVGRHTFATAAGSIIRDKKAVQVLLQHSSLEQTEVYMHLSNAWLHDVLKEVKKW